MPQYKLTYFQSKGRAEISRLILAAAGVPYDDVRVDLEAWKKIKSSSPSGQAPLLEVDGVILGQSMTIARFLAKRHGFAGKTDLEQAQADMIVDCVSDMIQPIITILYEKDQAKEAELLKKCEEEQLPASLEKLEKILVSNKGGDGFFVGNAMTWADLLFTDFITMPSSRFGMFNPQLEKYPKLAALCKRVESVPKVAEWIAKRPRDGLTVADIKDILRFEESYVHKTN